MVHTLLPVTLVNEAAVRSSSVLQGCLEKFSTKLSVILKAQGVSGPDLLTFICPSSRLTLIDSSAAFSFLCVCPSKDLMETTQSVKTKLQSFVKE